MGHQDKLERLRAAICDPTDADRALAAANELQRTATVEDIPRLVLMLEETSAFAREAAAWALSDLGAAGTLPHLVKAFQKGVDEGLDNDGFSAALVDLVEATPDESRRLLQILASEEEPPLRDVASWLLSFCKPSHVR